MNLDDNNFSGYSSTISMFLFFVEKIFSEISGKKMIAVHFSARKERNWKFPESEKCCKNGVIFKGSIKRRNSAGTFGGEARSARGGVISRRRMNGLAPWSGRGFKNCHEKLMKITIYKQIFCFFHNF